MSTAWVQTKDKLLLYAEQSPLDRSIFGSALTRLIYGISQEFGEERLRYLRQRIFSSVTLNLWEANLIKVCAKRFSVVSSFDTADIPEHKRINVGADLTVDPLANRHHELIGKIIGHRDAIALINKIAKEERDLNQAKNIATRQSSRPVSAMLCDQAGRIIAISVNTNATCQMRHAEVNLILQLRTLGIDHLPPASQVYTSLKPCRMCAALLRTYGQSAQDSSLPHIKVFSTADDPGPLGRHDLLDGIIEIKSDAKTD